MKTNKVFVSGCFDMMHSGHIRFLEEASTYGDVYVGIGSDDTIKELKGRYPITTQAERKYMLESLRAVKECVINSGTGVIDFLTEIKSIDPDYLIVNEEGNTPLKIALCKELDIKYVVLERRPHTNLPVRSTTSLRKECSIPYRIDLAGGWLDQPAISKYGVGPVIGISIEPTIEFNERSGMASSTRCKAIELWQTQIPEGDREKLAKVLFSYENPPGTTEISGSQDALNLTLQGVNRLNYNGAFWPYSIERSLDEQILSWLENCIYLIPLNPREQNYNAYANQSITTAKVNRLAIAATHCWNAIIRRDIVSLGKQVRASFEAQLDIFPSMITPEIDSVLSQYQSQALGWKISGAGGGGYLIFISDKPVKHALQIKICRKLNL